MLKSKTQSVALVGLAIGLGLAGCAGGGGGGGGIATGPVTPVQPTTPTTPTPTTVLTSNAGAYYQVPNVQNSAAIVSPAEFKVTITDQNGKLSAASLDSLDSPQFDGHQSIQVHAAGGDLVYDHTFAATDYVTGAVADDPRIGLSSAARAPALTSWETTSASIVSYGLYIYGLKKGLPGSAPTPTSVALTEVRTRTNPNRPWEGYFGLLGNQTATADMPKTGAAVFNGEAFGRLTSDNGFGSPFLGTVVMNADFSKTTGAITGAINNSLQSASSDALRLSVTFSADINQNVPSNFLGSAVATNANGGTALSAPLTGSIAGNFFGPTARPASEAGAVFSLVNSSQRLTGGFVAGR